MPRGDRTGPRALGSMTGRASGYCAGYPVPGFMNSIRGYGRGRGRGWRSYLPVVQPQSPEQKVAVLENYQKELEAEKVDLEQERNEIKSRIEEIKATPEQ